MISLFASENGRAYALKEVNLNGMKRAERQESIDEVRFRSSRMDVITETCEHSCFNEFFNSKDMQLEFAHAQARILSGLDCQYITQHFDSFIGRRRLTRTAIVWHFPSCNELRRMQPDRG